jgi:transposase
MMTITHTPVTRAQVWAAFYRAHDVRLRERYHSILLLMGGKSRPEVAQWLYRDEETIRDWARAFNEAGRPGLKRAPSPGRPT